jgi:phosphoglycerate kinase
LNKKLSVEDLALEGKRVFLRADLNVPLTHGQITDDARIRATLPTLRHCLKGGGAVIVASHLGRPSGTPDPRYSLAPVARRLAELLECPVPLAPDCVGDAVLVGAGALRPGDLLLLENLRFHPGEEANDPEFARALGQLADCYVNDAFSASHRAHASLVAITRFLQPAVAGLQLLREVEALTRILDRPDRPLVAILGGAKVSDKLTLVGTLLTRVDTLVIGGGMAFTFLRAQGHGIGRSRVEEGLLKEAERLLTMARERGVRLELPVDLVVGENPEGRAQGVVPVGAIPEGLMGLDVGPASVASFRDCLAEARTLVWNGPLGVFENPDFAAGTLELARAVAMSGAFSVAGGGDTVAAIHQAGVEAKIGYLSTAGGAFLEFLEGRSLPGIAALTDRE